MDFRQYDQALGRFYGMDMLGELAYNQTPYQYGFNNPILWEDRTGLFPSAWKAYVFAATEGIRDDYKIEYNAGLGGYVLTITSGEFKGDKFYDNTILMPDLVMDKTEKGKGGGKSDKRGKNEDGIVFATNTGENGPLKPDKGSRNGKIWDVSLIYFLVNAFVGPQTKIGYETDYNDKLNDKLVTIEYETFMIGVTPYYPAKHRAMKMMKDTMLLKSDIKKIDWNRKGIQYSIKATEKAKQLNKELNLE